MCCVESEAGMTVDSVGSLGQDVGYPGPITGGRTRILGALLPQFKGILISGYNIA
jgi:hypothetical protein